MGSRLSLAAYRNFCRYRGRRPLHDSYAAFQPFNEAFRALFAFLPQLRRNLRPGDKILSLWDRSGWTAAFLAGYFPEQAVTVTWEGDKDVLGYAGFAHWFAPEIKVEFLDFDQPWPFAAGEFRLVVGLDMLHRFPQALTLEEACRVTSADGYILFPHVHLANAEPAEYFSRGGRLVHGRHYQEVLAGVRISAIYAEPQLFQNPQEAQPDPETSDYNGLIAIFPEPPRPEAWMPLEEDDWERYFLLVNPLYGWNAERAWLDVEAISGQAGKLLSRHPIYRERLRDVRLETPQAEILYWAQRLLSASEIGQRLELTSSQLQGHLRSLAAAELVQLVPTSRKLTACQHLLSHQREIETAAQQTLGHLWQRAVTEHGDKTFLISSEEGSEFTFQDCHGLVSEVAASLESLPAGSRVAMWGPLHVEQILFFWGAVLMGLVVVPLNARLAPLEVERILDEVGAELVLVDLPGYRSLSGDWRARAIVVDGDEEADPARMFSQWLTPDPVPFRNLCPEDGAVVLYTSGTTARAKGVRLNHGCLYRSARRLADQYEWCGSDRYFSLAELDSMSGLRNAALCCAEVGAACILPGPSQKATLPEILELFARSRATLTVGSPAFYEQCLQLQGALRYEFASARLLLATGAPLDPHTQAEFFRQTGKPIYNYYGLTETSGLCVAQALGESGGGDVGRSVDCLLQVREGLLWVYTDNLFQGYWGQQDRPHGWYCTGDQASLHEDGKVELTGRRDDFLKNARGEMVSFLEVEQCLRGLDWLLDVAVYAENGRLAVAYVPAHSGSLPEQISAVKLRLLEQLGESRVPSFVRQVAEIPRNSAGKVQRHLCAVSS